VLDDLNWGVVDSLLKPLDPNSGASTRTWCARAKVALAVHASVLEGLTRNEAAKKVARDFRDFPGILGENQQLSYKRVLNWYDEFRKPVGESRITNTIARGIFENNPFSGCSPSERTP
jgi:hypothetical protein